ncbi:MAG: MBL fold metallo-hydrolase, partial [Bdellovibrionales bacterium]|nr:MBL fold metallo-hydrolase [Bdellovibrionales bacterium]
WDQSHSENNIRYTFMECRHRSGRGLSDHMKTLWGAFVIETEKQKIYFAGDTGYDDHFKKAANRFGSFDLSLLPIGAYEPRWFMQDPHVNPAEAVQAHIDLKSKFSMGIHFATFQLTYETIDQPIIDLQNALQTKGLSPDNFLVPQFGQSFHVP